MDVRNDVGFSILDSAVFGGFVKSIDGGHQARTQESFKEGGHLSLIVGRLCLPENTNPRLYFPCAKHQ